jgi:DNA-binding response OmpR family regulator
VIDLAQEGFVALSLIKQMKRSSNLKTTPILLLADSACLNEIHLALAEGANDFLLRPASPHELSARVKQLLRTHRT